MNKQTSYTDETLVNLAQKGDSDAYNVLFARYNKKIQQIIYLSIQDNANVSDLSQEVLIKVYRHLQFFKERSQFSTWLYRIIKNTIKNYYRKSNQYTDLEEQFAESYSPSFEDSPENLLINTEFHEQLATAVSTLSKELQTCYGMHILDGNTYEDIAKKLECPIGTVRSRIFRARKLVMASIEHLN